MVTSTHFEREYELTTHPKDLYPFLVSDYGLAKWFADEVVIHNERSYSFIWDKKTFPAKLVGRRQNKYAKFEFAPVDGENPTWMEFTIETNDLTQEVYLKVVDYTNDGDQEEMEKIWDNLIENLRESLLNV
ncbi:hypothetical protein SAMN05421823_10635 [Catalinimonas alkaloidigena]|uniref:START-like domain-containing protein n=1 Tax=Catalinimonas alkaloidigena TaxID=1075417 RepID=A0A1G9K393_9BACT|nr:START-like domain-containing protein [Catalinimonas alkaloidigena]SDL44199.1 hypothetical protein SAMN05421823_10635 [Catalinimonas alkaloidigena]